MTPAFALLQARDFAALTAALDDNRGVVRERVDGETLLHCASRDHLVRFVELLLERGANPNARDAARNTPLHLALKTDVPERALATVDALLHGEADPTLRDGWGFDVTQVARGLRGEGIERLLALFGGPGEHLESPARIPLDAQRRSLPERDLAGLARFGITELFGTELHEGAAPDGFEDARAMQESIESLGATRREMHARLSQFATGARSGRDVPGLVEAVDLRAMRDLEMLLTCVADNTWCRPLQVFLREELTHAAAARLVELYWQYAGRPL